MFASLIALTLAAGLESPAPDILHEARLPDHPWVQTCEDWDEWDKPGPPFKVFGNTWYVGTCGIAAILIVGDDGLVLIDSGTEGGADIVAHNIASLGHDIADIEALLVSHEHFDHVGGMAKLQELTGAPVYAGAVAASVLRTGLTDPQDPQHEIHEAMAPVARVRQVRDGEIGTVAGVEITPIATPGHTPGAYSWSWTSCEGEDCRRIVYADSLSAVSAEDYRFSDHPDYVAAFENSLVRIASLECDILLTPHPSASSMRERLQDRQSGFGVGHPCTGYSDAQAARLEARLVREAGTAAE